jgi:Xaa-Pro dipeptidase
MTATGAAAAATALAPGASARAAGPEKPPALPPALSPDVFRDRQVRLRAAAKAGGMDLLFVTPSTNLAYAANLAIGRSERLTALLLFTDGPAVLVTPFFEAENHRRNAVVDDVVTWKENEDPIALVAARLGGAKVAGIEGTTAYDTVTRLTAAAPVAPRDAAVTFDSLRMIKSPEEQAFIREAARRTSLAIEATHRRLAGGKTESEISTILEQEFQALGVHGGGLVQFGPSAALPHGGPGDRRLATGDVVLIDAGCSVRGYDSDVTRTVAFGAPSDEVRKVYAVVDAAQRAGIEALKAGVPAEDVDRAARKVVEEAGYAEYFTHRLGHGLGLDGHEPPYLVSGNAAPLAAGNTVTIEPGIYLPGKFGVRIEDDYAVRESAPPASLSARPGELLVLKA